MVGIRVKRQAAESWRSHGINRCELRRVSIIETIKGSSRGGWSKVDRKAHFWGWSGNFMRIIWFAEIFRSRLSSIFLRVVSSSVSPWSAA